MPRHDALPPTLQPLGLCRAAASAFLGISTTTFDQMVQDGRMPGPKRIGSRKVWDRRALEVAFSALPGDGDANPWDEP
ncbi:hypothetical protein E0493_05345 [Roseomonas sp. M0104]|uniref:DNA-binding protein n=1 Tax=Teichococcus coralli TaxID=2545983 RepID=A0A845B9J7_9PROT|nr:hypothetical protein [Pseudoroseomonas coralli]